MATTYLRSKVFPPEKAHLTTPEEERAWRIAQTRGMLQDNTMLTFKVVPTADPERIVAYSGWYKPAQPNMEKTDMQANEDNDDDDDGDDQPLASMDLEVSKQHSAAVDEARKSIWGEDGNYWGA